MDFDRQAILSFIDEFLNDHRYAPSLREIMAVLPTRSLSTARSIMEEMKSEGLIDYIPNGNRTYHRK